MRKFEIPFNHTKSILDFLEKYRETLIPYISHLLVAPFVEDYHSTRHKEAIKPLSRSKYEKQIEKLQELGYTPAILINGIEKVKQEFLDYYINKLHCNTFIVHSDEIAKYIKDNYKNIITIASITKKLSLKDIQEKDLSMYDYIVLFYTFNASLENIKKLPNKYKYILMVNTYCDYTCDFNTHWFTDDGSKCPRYKNGEKNTTCIFSEDLNIFDPYISIYKLQGREYETDMIVREIMYWIFNKEKYKIDGIIRDRRESLGIEGFYNRYKGE